MCTHNPRPHYLRRVLSALAVQSLNYEHWELLLVDNGSKELLSQQFDLSWHPHGRHIREEELGLTAARLRGITEARGKILIFVDDDNVLASDYLNEAIRLGELHPFLGAWGGNIELEFEIPPPEWVLQYRAHFAFRHFSRARWSNVTGDIDSQPYGAGMCLRSAVCEVYATNIKDDKFRRSLDRRGESLLAGGDLDLVLSSAELSLGWGNFPSLNLLHLIPQARFQEQYMLKLREEVTMSNIIISELNGDAYPVSPTWRHRMQFLWRLIRYGRHSALFLEAEHRGRQRGINAARAYKDSKRHNATS